MTRPVAMVVACLGALMLPAPGAAQDDPGSWRSRLSGPRAAVALTTGAADERREAATILGRRGDATRAVAALTQALPAEREPGVRRAIVRALARRGDPAAVPVLVSALGAGDGAGRESVASALAAIGSGTAVRALVEALGDTQAGPAAATALLQVGDEAIPLLLQALEDRGVAPRAARVLGELRTPLAVPALVALASSDRPPTRRAAVRSLGAIGDDRAVRALVECTSDPSEEVVLAALDALGALGGPAEVPLLVARIRDGSEAERRAALGALLQIDPERGATLIAERLEGRSSVPRPLAAPILRWPHPALVPVLSRLLAQGDPRAADVLAEVDGGAGLPVLLRAVTASADPDGALSRSIAVALRRWPEQAPEGAHRALAQAAGSGLRGLTLRALAGDGSAAKPAVAALSHADPFHRATAAHALTLLGDRAHAPSVRQALAVERDPEAFRALARAAWELGVRMPPSALWRWMHVPATSPEAMLLAARSLEGERLRARLRFRELLRRRLRAADPRVRAGAARALAEAGDRQAWRALASRLDDPMPEVRHAVARALAALAVDEARPSMRARLRVEDDPRVRQALRFAGTGPVGHSAHPFILTGDQVLRVRIATAEAHRRVLVDLVLPDGRWLRQRTLPSGELFLTDLPAGTADVRVRLGL